MSNIDHFDDLVAVIFKMLYSDFPIPAKLDMGEIDLDQAIDKKFKNASIDWLKDSGFIKYDSVFVGSNGNIYTGVTLTYKGLELLKMTPESLSSTQSIGERLTSGAIGIGKEAGRNLIRVAFTEGFKMLMRY